jgi:hypothetical protein
LLKISQLYAKPTKSTPNERQTIAAVTQTMTAAPVAIAGVAVAMTDGGQSEDNVGSSIAREC